MRKSAVFWGIKRLLSGARSVIFSVILIVASATAANAVGCSAGYYFDSNEYGSGTSNYCKQCLPGYYCPGISNIATSQMGQDISLGMTPCPEGKYNPNAGSTSLSACSTCSSGTYSFEGARRCSEFAMKTRYEGLNSVSFNISAAGTYTIDWGDGSAIETITKTDTTETTYSHTFSRATSFVGDHRSIGISGQATAYSTTRMIPAINFTPNGTSNDWLAGIKGSLGKVFGTLSSGTQKQPNFYKTFYTSKMLSGSIPSTLFSGITGQAQNDMFFKTFYGCNKLTGSIPSGLFSGLNTTPTDNLFADTFSQCSGLTGTIPSSLFSGVHGQPAYGMFMGTFAGTGLSGAIPAGLFANISGTPRPFMYSGTFYGATGLTTIPSGLFGDIYGQPANNMYAGTFRDCTGLTSSIPSGLFGDIYGTPAENMYALTFYNCSKLTGSIPSGLFGDLTGEPATQMFYNTFDGCANLTGTIPANLFGNLSGTAKTYMFRNTFYGCSKLSGYVDSRLFPVAAGSAEAPYANTFTNASGMSTSCPAGTTPATKPDSSWTVAVCTPCAPGSYGTTAGGACTLCSAGKYNPNEGSTSSSACTTCPPGSTSAAGAAACSYRIIYDLNGGSGTTPSYVLCPIGDTLTLNDGKTNSFYRAGYVLAGWSTSSTATTGSWSITPTISRTVYAVWQKCPAGSYKPTTAQARTSCTVCGTNQHSVPGDTSCRDCPGGLTNSGSTAADHASCWITCAPGTYAKASDGTTTCESCDQGYYCTGKRYSLENLLLGTDMGVFQCPQNVSATTASGSTTTYSFTSDGGKSQITDCYITSRTGEYKTSTNDDSKVTFAYCPAANYCPSGRRAYYNTAESVSSLPTCPTNYDDNTATGKSDNRQCKILCAAGTQINTANATSCTVPSGSWWTQQHYVEYGKTSALNYCMNGYSNSYYTTATGHDSYNDCFKNTSGGQYLDKNYIPAQYINISSSSQIYLHEIQAFTNSSGTDTSIFAGKTVTSGDSNTLSWATEAVDGNLTAGNYARGTSITVNAGSIQNVYLIKFSIRPATVTIKLSTDNTNWTIVWSGTVTAADPSTGNVTLSQLRVQPNKFSSCAQNSWRGVTTAWLGNTISCNSCSSSPGKGYNYTESDGASASSACYLTTAAGEYVATANTAAQTCDGNKYCTGGTKVFYGSTGGAAECPTVETNWTLQDATGRTAITQCVETRNLANETNSPCTAGFLQKTAEATTDGKGRWPSTSSDHIVQPLKAQAGAHVYDYGCAECDPGTYNAENNSTKTQCDICPENAYTASDTGLDHDGWGATECIACKTGYKTYGRPSGPESCAIACPAGTYLANANDDTCTPVGAGYYSKPTSLVTQGQTSTRSACPTGLTTIGFGPGADSADDCGHVLNIGGDKLYLRSVKETDLALNVRIGNTVYYGNMDTTIRKMSDNATKKLRLRIKDDATGTYTDYSVFDESSVGWTVPDATTPWDLAVMRIQLYSKNWAVSLPSFGVLSGTSVCDETSKPVGDTLGKTPSGTGTSCYCRVTGPNTSTHWISSGETFESAYDCSALCSSSCLSGMYYETDDSDTFRRAIFESARITVLQ